MPVPLTLNIGRWCAEDATPYTNDEADEGSGEGNGSSNDGEGQCVGAEAGGSGSGGGGGGGGGKGGVHALAHYDLRSIVFHSGMSASSTGSSSSIWL